MFRATKWLMSVLGMMLSFSVSAHIGPTNDNIQPQQGTVSEDASVAFREPCVTATEQIDQDINNVRARLTTGGDVWWDRQDGRYVVPKVAPGEPEVSSIFAGAVWVGGEVNGSLKVAAQLYGNGSGNSDFWAGPLTEEGLTNDTSCLNWDRFFTVTGLEIDEHLRNFNNAQAGGTEYTANMIPLGVRQWPAIGNPYFFDLNEFDLPDAPQGLGSFFDADGDEEYNPLNGDYPVIEIRGCDENPQYPDQMIFWIYNDNGNIHAETNGDAIRMEIQVQAFAFATNDQINDMTFQRYKLINRAPDVIDSTYFAIWVDADLGCYTDDYIGCDTARSFGYYYNADAEDGDVGVSCPGGVNTYGTNIPALGVDYFRGPRKPIFAEDNFTVIDTVELGMSAFTYFNNGGVGDPPPGTQDPNEVGQFYNYLTGSWLDGSPFQFGGDAYQEASGEPINYAFTEPPNDPTGWNMCNEGLPEFDRRTIQASGPFRLLPGAVNELIIGAVWVPDLTYPCPNLKRLFDADDIAQSLFDNCFERVKGPDAPDVDIIELDRELVLVLTNDTIISNNAYEAYEEEDTQAPAGNPDLDISYNFQGYQIYQLVNPNVSGAEFDNPDKARLIYQVDTRDDIVRIFNWEEVDESPLSDPVFVPVLKNEVANNDGIRHTFTVDTDQFASGDSRLVNHKKYYFSAIAYGFVDWETFDPNTGEGQKVPYVGSSRNIKAYTGIPRIITDRQLNAAYGDGAVITRLDGIGAGGNFLDMNDETKAKINDGSFDGTIVYEEGRGPIEVKVYNPLEVKDAEFILRFDQGGDVNDDTRWTLENELTNETINSETSIGILNEQLLGDFGVSVSVTQTPDAGCRAVDDCPGDNTNGVVGYEEEYADANGELWFSGVPDEGGDAVSGFQSQLFDYVSAQDGDLDPSNAFTTNGNGYFVPFQIANYRVQANSLGYASPGWVHPQAGLARNAQLLGELNNVDIVFTDDQSQWSRCVVVETWSSYYEGITNPEGNANQFLPRQTASVKKTGGDVPDVDNNESRQGMGWFPGYAIDVETGKRLNIFFGENSGYDCSLGCEFYENGVSTSNDMMFNPSSQTLIERGGFTSIFDAIGGGQHYIYVTNEEYDGCDEIYTSLNNSNPLFRIAALQKITWAGFPLLATGSAFKSYGEGLIPNDLTVKLRVDNPYARKRGTNANDGYPMYRFAITGKEAAALDEPSIESALDLINVVPNPYYAFSDYESNEVENIVKITNLPAKCTVSIYSLDGKFIRRYNRDEVAPMPAGNNRGVPVSQVVPDIDWDLKNSKGIPIAGGVYLIHVNAPDYGERVIKWFGTNREFDPSGL